MNFNCTLSRHAKVERLKCWSHIYINKAAHAQRGGGGGEVDSFTRINTMANVYLLLPGSTFSCIFLLIGPLRGMRAR